MSGEGTFVAPTQKFYNRSNWHFGVPSAGLENRQNSRVSEKPAGMEVKKFRSSLFKGLWVSRGQSPPFALKTDNHTFSQLKKRSCPHCSAQRNPKYCPKRKSALFRHFFRVGRDFYLTGPRFLFIICKE